MCIRDRFPAAVKIGGQYVNSQLIAMEAARHGYVEGIALDASGFVSEGSGENVFVVANGHIVTPPAGSSILQGITRNCVMRLAADLGYTCLLYTSPSPRDRTRSRMPSSA